MAYYLILSDVATEYLNGDGGWSTPAGGGGGLGYLMSGSYATGLNVDIDNGTYYFGIVGSASDFFYGWSKMVYILKAGTIKVAYINWVC